MNMSKKIFIVLIIFMSLFFVNSYAVYADTTTLKSCNTFDKTGCDINKRCKWNAAEKSCQDAYLVDDPCSDENILKAINFFGYLLMILRIAIPLVIIVMGTMDLFKSVVDKDEKSLSKQLKILGMRVAAGIFVFFIPNLVYALFGISTELNIVEEAKYQACADCLLKPTECKLSD